MTWDEAKPVLEMMADDPDMPTLGQSAVRRILQKGQAIVNELSIAEQLEIAGEKAIVITGPLEVSWVVETIVNAYLLGKEGPA